MKYLFLVMAFAFTAEAQSQPEPFSSDKEYIIRSSNANDGGSPSSQRSGHLHTNQREWVDVVDSGPVEPSAGEKVDVVESRSVEPSVPAGSVEEDIAISQNGVLDNCESPSGVEILHVPVQSWTELAEFTKNKQDIFNKVKNNTQKAVSFIREEWDFVRQEVGNLFEENTNKTDEETQTDKDTQEDQEIDPNFILPRISEIAEKRAYAHFQLIQIIRTQPQAMVFHEFTTQVMDSRILDVFKQQTVFTQPNITTPDQLLEKENRKMRDLFQLVQSQFPDGMPSAFHELSPEQKETLSIVGGVYTLFFLYGLPMIFPALSYLEYNDLLKELNLSFNEMKFCDELNVAHICPTLSLAITEQPFIRVFKAQALSQRVKAFVKHFPQPFYEFAPHQSGFSSTDTLKPSVILAYGGEIESQSFFEDSGIKHGDYDNPIQVEQALKRTSNRDLKSYFEFSDNFYRLPQTCLTQSQEM